MKGYKTKISDQQKQIIDYANKLEEYDRKFDESSRKFNALFQVNLKFLCTTKKKYYKIFLSLKGY